MTVPASAERNDYTGNGTTATYAYSFRITDDDHLLCTVADADGVETTLVKGTDYSVTGVGVKTGGNIVLIDAGQDWIDGSSYLASTWVMSIRHYVPLAQLTDIRNLGAYYPETHEDAFDYLMWAIKQQQDEIDRSVKAGETGGDIPTPAEMTETLAATQLAQAAAEAAQAAAETAETNAETAETGAEAAQVAAEAAAASIPSLASQAEAEAGTENTKIMTALRVAQAITALGTQIITGSFTRDISTASGNQAITGVGFTPRILFIFGAADAAAKVSFGLADVSNANCIYFHATDSKWYPVSSTLLRVHAGSGSYQDVTLSSLDADGFTLTWAKTGTPTGTFTGIFLAIG